MNTAIVDVEHDIKRLARINSPGDWRKEFESLCAVGIMDYYDIIVHNERYSREIKKPRPSKEDW